MILQIGSCLAEEAWICFVERIAILQEEPDQGREVIDLDIAVHVSRSKSDRPPLYRLAQDAEIFEAQNGMFASGRVADGPRAAIGQDNRDAPVLGVTQQLYSGKLQGPGGKTGPQRNAGIGLVYYGFIHGAAVSSYSPVWLQRAAAADSEASWAHP